MKRIWIYSLSGITLIAFGMVGASIVSGWNGGAEGQNNQSDALGNLNSPVLAGDMDERLPANAIEPMMQRATHGDNVAANGLGNYFSQTGNINEERRWRTLAANRGDCLSMTLLKDLESHVGDRSAVAHWNNMLRRNVCTWEKAYGNTADPELNPLPLWN